MKTTYKYNSFYCRLESNSGKSITLCEKYRDKLGLPENFKVVVSDCNFDGATRGTLTKLPDDGTIHLWTRLGKKTIFPRMDYTWSSAYLGVAKRAYVYFRIIKG
jgi:hypothetical protein